MLALQFLKVLPCDSLINQARYLNLAGSKSNKLRLSGKNTPSRHTRILTCTCSQSLSMWQSFSEIDIFNEIYYVGTDCFMLRYHTLAQVYSVV